jgi:hypothetical protein
VYPKFTGLMRKTKNPLHKKSGYKKRRELSSTKIYIIADFMQLQKGDQIYAFILSIIISANY